MDVRNGDVAGKTREVDDDTHGVSHRIDHRASGAAPCRAAYLWVQDRLVRQGSGFDGG